MYKTSTTVVLAQSTGEQSSSSVTLNDISINQKLVATYTEIVKSKLVLEQVINDLKLDTTAEKLAKHVTVAAIEDTEILKITVEDGNRIAAAQIANKIADVFTKEIVNIYQLKQQIDVVSDGDAAPLHDGIFDGNDLRQPNGLLAASFELVSQVISRPFVGKNHCNFLIGKVVVTEDMAR